MPESILQWIHEYGYFALFVLLMLGIVGLPIPDEILVTFAGSLIRRGEMHILPAGVICLFASSCGITLSYLLGLWLGPPVVRRFGRWLHLTDARMERVHDWYGRVGKWLIMFCYFLPGFRHVTAILAGTTRLSYGQFALFAYVGALIWVCTFLTLGYYLGGAWRQVHHQLHAHLVAASLIAAGLAGGYVLFRILWLRRQSAGRRKP